MANSDFRQSKGITRTVGKKVGIVYFRRKFVVYLLYLCLMKFCFCLAFLFLPGVVDEYGKVLLEDGSLVHLVGAGLSVFTCMNRAQMECVYNLCRECVARKKEEILEGRDLDPTFPVNKRRHDSYIEGKLHCEVCRSAGLFDHSLRREECPDFFTQAFFRARDAVKSKRDYFRYCAGCKAENWGWDVGKEIPQRRQFPAAEDTDEILAV